MKIQRMMTCVSLIVLSASSVASASTMVPNAVYSGYLQDNAYGTDGQTGQNPTFNMNYNKAFNASNTVSTSFGSSASGSVFAKSNPSPSVSAMATLHAGGNNYPIQTTAGSTSNATITYDFEIQGPAPSVSLFVDASGKVSVSGNAPGATSNQIAEAEFSVGSYRSNGFNADYIDDQLFVNAYNGAPTAPQSFQEHKSYVFDTDVLYQVQIYAEVSGSLSSDYGGGNEMLSAYINPTFTIASGQPDAKDYSIAFSAGVGNGVPSVPLPSSAPLFGAALAIVGAGSYIATRSQKVAKQL